MDKRLRAIFQTDDGSDIRATYREAILSGMTEDEAEQLTVEEFPTKFIWMFLALVEWEIGRMSDKAKENALRGIEERLSLSDHPFTEQQNRERIERLHLLKETLLSPMPEKKKLRKPWYSYDCPWSIGEVIQYKITFPAENNPFFGSYVLLQVVSREKTLPGKLPYGELTVALYDYVSERPIAPFLCSEEPVLKKLNFISEFRGKRNSYQHHGILLTRQVAKEHEMLRVSAHPLDGNPAYEVPMLLPLNSTFETDICRALSERHPEPTT